MLLFLKLGGSLITHKDQPRAPRAGVLTRLMGEIAAARVARPSLDLVLGHGSGSFGHVVASRHGTREGVRTPGEWRGFAEVQRAAGLLNRQVVDAAWEAGLPVVNLPPSASAICQEGTLRSMALEPVRVALEHGLVPLVFGDVALDETSGGTIVSTEAVFGYLAVALCPTRILLAGIEPGVLTHWPAGEVITHITPDTPLTAVGAAQTHDVTGGMAGKVRQMQKLVAAMPGLEVRVFSGDVPGAVRGALLGEAGLGTVIRGS